MGGSMRRQYIFARGGALALAIAFGASLNFGARAFEVTQAQEEACEPDAFRLCSAEIPDAGRVAACMDANVANLSPPCRAVFQVPVAAVTSRSRYRVRKISAGYEHKVHHHRYVSDRDDASHGKWARD